MYCKRCKKDTEWHTSKAFLNTLTGYPDFFDSDYVCTLSRTGPAGLVEVLKCSECGRSFVMNQQYKEQMENPNVNCLKGMQCPKCSSFGSFMIEVSAIVEVTDDGSDAQPSELDWGIESYCRCSACGFHGIVVDFLNSAS